MNVVLVTVDSLRVDHVGYMGYDRETTPFLDDLADRGVFFERAYSPSNHTREAVPSILTGRYPEDAVTRTYRMKAPTVAETLSEEGYDTGAFLGAPFFTSRWNYDSGFDEFDSEYSTRTFRNFAGYVRDIVTNSQFRDGFDINDRLLDFVADADDPFFAWGHYMDVHAPYNRCDEAVFGAEVDPRKVQYVFRKANYLPSTVTEEEHQLLVDYYDSSVRHFDRVMRDLVERLEASGAMEDTLLFVVSDHGESLGEDGRYEHHAGFYPELVHVPVWIHGDGDDVVEKPVSTVDVAPTVAEASHADVSLEGFDGQPLDAEISSDRSIKSSYLDLFRRREQTITGIQQ